MFLAKTHTTALRALRTCAVFPRPVGVARHSLRKHLFSTSQTLKAKDLGLESLGISNDSATVYRNLSYEDIAVHERENNEGVVAANGTFAVDTGKFTGRSPKDKWFVKQAPSEKDIWWGDINQPIEPAGEFGLSFLCVSVGEALLLVL